MDSAVGEKVQKEAEPRPRLGSLVSFALATIDWG